MTLSSFLKFWNRDNRSAEPLSKAVRHRLTQGYGVSEQRAASLRMLTERGDYAGRKVTYVRVFDPGAAKLAGIDPRQYADLNRYPQLHLYYGNIESDGDVVLTRPDMAADGAAR